MRALGPGAILAVSLLLANAAFADPPHPPLYPGERLLPVMLPPTGPLHLGGWTRSGNGDVYSLHVLKGQKLDIRFESRSKFAYLVIFDLGNTDDEAIYSSDENGLETRLTATANTTWLIRPYYSRMSPRRGLGAPYGIVIAND